VCYLDKVCTKKIVGGMGPLGSFKEGNNKIREGVTRERMWIARNATLSRVMGVGAGGKSESGGGRGGAACTWLYNNGNSGRKRSGLLKDAGKK